jgi:hypothetical protein
MAVAISWRVPVSPPATGRRPSSRPPPSTHRGIDPLGLHYNAELRWRPSFWPGGKEGVGRSGWIDFWCLPSPCCEHARRAPRTSAKPSRPKIDQPLLLFPSLSPGQRGRASPGLGSKRPRPSGSIPLRADSAPGGRARRSMKSRQAQFLVSLLRRGSSERALPARRPAHSAIARLGSPARRVGGKRNLFPRHTAGATGF